MGRVKNSVRGWGSPSRYFQGPGLLEKLSDYTGLYGKRVFAVIDRFFFEELSVKLKKEFANTDSELESIIFNSEVTEERIKNAAAGAKKYSPDVIVGIGGGKTIDTAKAIADICGKPVIIVPTSASTDAPTIALSVLYSEEGRHIKERHYLKNPDVVLVDSAVIAKAPVRFLVAGMGDALSTTFEARAAAGTDSANFVSGGYRRTKSGYAIAELCYKLLMQNGVKAMQAVSQGVVTEAVEDIIEVNTLMSGLGVENNGCAGSHSICEGISVLPEDRKTFHGEKVGFGVLCQLMAEDAPMPLMEEIFGFCIAVGLPVTLSDLFIENTTENRMAIAVQSMKSYWDIEPFYIDSEMVAQVIAATDIFGNEMRERLCGQPAWTRRE